jgi:hypothetical protein
MPHLTTVVIGTVPAVAGFPVTLEGVTQLTDAAGNVQFDTAITSQPLDTRVTLNEATLTIGDRQVKAKATRLYRYPEGAQIALDLSYLVGFHFTNLRGLAESSINTLTVKSVTGEVAELSAQQPSWLAGTRAVPTDNGLEAKPVDWSVQQVRYGGSNVVNEAQQRFSPASHSMVNVRLLFFSVDVHVRDALFGFSRSSAVDLTFPNGRTQRFSLDRQGWLHVPTVPRGDYVITPLGSGPHLPHPLTISRNQKLDIAFFSWLDVAVVLGVVLVLAAVLAVVGRLRRHPIGRWGLRRLAPGARHADDALATQRPAAEDVRPAPHPADTSSDLAVTSDRGSR